MLKGRESSSEGPFPWLRVDRGHEKRRRRERGQDAEVASKCKRGNFPEGKTEGKRCETKDPRVPREPQGRKGRKQAIGFLGRTQKDSEAHENHESGEGKMGNCFFFTPTDS